MQTLLFRIKTTNNPHLSDDEIVAECMEKLMQKWPQVKGYQYERDENAINILLWGDIEGDPEEDDERN